MARQKKKAPDIDPDLLDWNIFARQYPLAAQRAEHHTMHPIGLAARLAILECYDRSPRELVDAMRYVLADAQSLNNCAITTQKWEWLLERAFRLEQMAPEIVDLYPDVWVELTHPLKADWFELRREAVLAAEGNIAQPRVEGKTTRRERFGRKPGTGEDVDIDFETLLDELPGCG